MAEPLSSILGRILGGNGKSDESSFLHAQIAETLTYCSATSEDAFHQFKMRCESPIEKLAFAALLRFLPDAVVVHKVGQLEHHADWTLAVIPQMPHSGYRLDFGVIRRDNRIIHAVECDGAYHKDPLRMKADIDRTVKLWKAGVLVYRIDGSALYRNPTTAIRPFLHKLWGDAQ